MFKKVVVFIDLKGILIVGIDKYNKPIDLDGTLFGSESGRDIEQ